jgi:hypothetical protein
MIAHLLLNSETIIRLSRVMMVVYVIVANKIGNTVTRMAESNISMKWVDFKCLKK